MAELIWEGKYKDGIWVGEGWTWFSLAYIRVCLYSRLKGLASA